jgi:hypothetical protein
MKQTTNIAQDRTNYLVYLIAIIVSALGVLLIYWASPGEWLGSRQPLTTILQALGITLLTSVSIGLLWELFVRRTFLEELKMRIGIAGDIDAAGLIGFTDHFYESPEWESYFTKSNQLDIFFAYGSTWRNVNEGNLRVFVKKGGEIRVVLPNPDDTNVMNELARRFSYSLEEMVSKEKEALVFFESLKRLKDDAKVKIWLTSKAPLFTFYRFNSTIILSLYNHRPGRGGVPTFIASEGGKLYDNIILEFDSMIQENGLAVLYPGEQKNDKTKI